MSATDWKTQVIKADRTWAKESVRPLIYEFSNGRKFHETERPSEPYPWLGTSA